MGLLKMIIERIYDKDTMRKFRKLAIVCLALGLMFNSIYIRGVVRDPDFEIVLDMVLLICVLLIFSYIRSSFWFDE